MNKIYPSDMTDEQWAVLELLIPPSQGGRPRKADLRRMVNGIFYRNKAGCQWRMLPQDFGPWGKVYYYFAKWRQDGTWRRLNDALRERVRSTTINPPPTAGRCSEPTTAHRYRSWRLPRSRRVSGLSARRTRTGVSRT